jgi:hypothetical protein
VAENCCCFPIRIVADAGDTEILFTAAAGVPVLPEPFPQLDTANIVRDRTITNQNRCSMEPHLSEREHYSNRVANEPTLTCLIRWLHRAPGCHAFRSRGKSRLRYRLAPSTPFGVVAGNSPSNRSPPTTLGKLPVVSERLGLGNFRAVRALSDEEVSETPLCGRLGAGDNRRPQRSAYSVFKKAIARARPTWRRRRETWLSTEAGGGFRPASSVLILRWPVGDSLDRVGSDTRRIGC